MNKACIGCRHEGDYNYCSWTSQEDCYESKKPTKFEQLQAMNAEMLGKFIEIDKYLSNHDKNAIYCNSIFHKEIKSIIKKNEGMK